MISSEGIERRGVLFWDNHNFGEAKQRSPEFPYQDQDMYFPRHVSESLLRFEGALHSPFELNTKTSISVQ